MWVFKPISNEKQMVSHSIKIQYQTKQIHGITSSIKIQSQKQRGHVLLSLISSQEIIDRTVYQKTYPFNDLSVYQIQHIGQNSIEHPQKHMRPNLFAIDI